MDESTADWFWQYLSLQELVQRELDRYMGDA
jgi:hypothetical protein